MICYRCGSELTKEEFCTNCGAEVGLYKKICATSNLYYNRGLERAEVRDLTGAMESLRLSLKYNKHNTDARNLLGLIYFEMGEASFAIREWIVSTNFYQKDDKKNLAERYLSIYRDEARLDMSEKAIKKYNLALGYCYSDGLDLATIQLKRVLSTYPKFVRARQLLALLYLKEENHAAAARELEKCMQIDNGSPLTRKLYQEATRFSETEEAAREKRGFLAPDSVRYVEDGETIITPGRTGKPLGFMGGLAYGVIGILLGVGFSLFLIMPARITTERASFDEKTREIAEQIDAKNAVITELERQVNALEKEKSTLEEELYAFSAVGDGTDAASLLILAAKTYIESPGNISEVGDYLAQADALGDPASLGESYQELYSTLVGTVGPSLAEEAYTEGARLYQASAYAEAIPYFERSLKMDASNPQAYLMLGNAYRRNNDTENAIRVYEQLIDRLPDSDEALRAADSLGELQGA